MAPVLPTLDIILLITVVTCIDLNFPAIAQRGFFDLFPSACCFLIQFTLNTTPSISYAKLFLRFSTLFLY